MIKNCEYCKKDYVTRNGWQKYCLKEHQKAARYYRLKQKGALKTAVQKWIEGNMITEPLRWAMTLANSSNDALREAAEMLSKGKIKFKEWDKKYISV